jgi:ribosomal protein S18 acetylase RimI-like enzyme
VEKTVIRRLKSEDVPEIRRISTSINPNDKTDFKRFIKKQTQNEDDASYVAERGNQLVGYCISYALYSGNFGMDKSAWMARLGVDPEFMGQGIGEKLATKVLKDFKNRGIKDIYTSVRWDSTDLLSFFKTLGFQRSEFFNLRKSLE